MKRIAELDRSVCISRFRASDRLGKLFSKAEGLRDGGRKGGERIGFFFFEETGRA